VVATVVGCGGDGLDHDAMLQHADVAVAVGTRSAELVLCCRAYIPSVDDVVVVVVASRSPLVHLVMSPMYQIVHASLMVDRHHHLDPGQKRTRYCIPDSHQSHWPSSCCRSRTGVAQILEIGHEHHEHLGIANDVGCVGVGTVDAAAVDGTSIHAIVLEDNCFDVLRKSPRSKT